MEIQTFISAFVVGILGGVHCVGMCGGIVASLSIGLHPDKPSKPDFTYLLAYNLARITAYTLAGVMIGWLGAAMIDLLAVNTGQQFLSMIAGLFMVLLGLYLANWWRVLTRLETLGSHVWRYIEPFGRRFIPIKNVRHAFLLGFIWGWLPCGLVYSVLIWTLSSGSAWQGGLTMLAFGLGTLPNLLLMGMFAVALRNVMKQRWLRVVAGLVIVCLGCYQIFRAIAVLFW